MDIDNLQLIQETSTFIQEQCNLFEGDIDNYREIYKIIRSNPDHKKSFMNLITSFENLVFRCGKLNHRIMMIDNVSPAN